MLLKQEAYCELKNRCSIPKMKFDMKVHTGVISFIIDTVPFCVAFSQSNLFSNGEFFCQKFSNLFKLYQPFIKVIE